MSFETEQKIYDGGGGGHRRGGGLVETRTGGGSRRDDSRGGGTGASDAREMDVRVGDGCCHIADVRGGGDPVAAVRTMLVRPARRVAAEAPAPTASGEAPLHPLAQQ